MARILWGVACRSENRGFFGYELKNISPVSQQLRHVNEPSLLKAVMARQTYFAALPAVMLSDS
jgi:hypothetical protein